MGQVEKELDLVFMKDADTLSEFSQLTSSPLVRQTFPFEQTCRTEFMTAVKPDDVIEECGQKVVVVRLRAVVVPQRPGPVYCISLVKEIEDAAREQGGTSRSELNGNH